MWILVYVEVCSILCRIIGFRVCVYISVCVCIYNLHVCDDSPKFSIPVVYVQLCICAHVLTYIHAYFCTQGEIDSLKNTITTLEQDLARNISEFSAKLSAEEEGSANLRARILELEASMHETNQQLADCM
jgi:hypothetical protein